MSISSLKCPVGNPAWDTAAKLSIVQGVPGFWSLPTTRGGWSEDATGGGQQCDQMGTFSIHKIGALVSENDGNLVTLQDRVSSRATLKTKSCAKNA